MKEADGQWLESSGFFNVDGVQLEYQWFTPLQGIDLTLVFLHEGLGCVAMWKDFPRRVARLTGCRVLIYSRAGYGGSDPCPLPRPLSFMQDEGLRVLPKILNAAGIRNAVLVGHSDGASIALINVGGIADARIQGLILMAPHVFVEELTLRSIRAAKTAFETTDLRERLSRYHGDNVDCAFLGWSQAWLDQDFLGWNLDTYLPNIKVPVLLLQGEQDNYGTLRQLDRITELLPNAAETLLLSGCGHSPFRDRLDDTLQGVADFLKIHFDGMP
ncbi:MAG: alpha/beta hydrolase [Kiritimatiellales bacterium]|nr:alpha/beta hydrolase [Kiritimatiellales bacterium]